MGVYERRNERDRRIGHLAVLRVALPDGAPGLRWPRGSDDHHRTDDQHHHHVLARRGGGGRGLLRRRPSYHSSVQDHAYHANFQAGAALHGPPVHRLHPEEQLQRVGLAYALPGHGSVDLFLAVLLCREGGAGHAFLFYTRLILVGHHYHDHSRLWRHVTHHGGGEDYRYMLRHLGRVGHGPAHSHYW